MNHEEETNQIKKAGEETEANSRAVRRGPKEGMGSGEEEIQITRAMFIAGRDALSLLDFSSGLSLDDLSRVYIAMRSLEQERK